MDDDEIAKQAEMMKQKMASGGLKKKGPLIGKQKKNFDSADYFKDKEQGGEGGN
eukprot:CAMPEP_0114581018 /NCGR_PEP_ID=MMETSP0125-20121206/5169_1 /TAXON_ID=485358 ORGANISM="Aristerostoma sp., Strain ATCC 50986" /NCGR_SAMPLE_ID=MMETSP0125 /ASSEMBLY_ACC=CAM_ASM_000245 /LENGTH=53 /DNA_ID=CAMNT_0001772891 /DNA_START=79 /DNA_END=240 /DNA_ORIENTATION=-